MEYERMTAEEEAAWLADVVLPPGQWRAFKSRQRGEQVWFLALAEQAEFDRLFPEG